MADTHETVADIIAEMRALSNPISDGIIAINGRIIADRLESAHKRERGDCAKLREAALAIRADILKRRSENCWYATDSDILEKIDAALAAPPRNCDALSAQEQTEKFNQFCRSHRNSDLPKCAGCPLEDISDGTGCAQAWGQMPYEEGGAE